MSNIKTTIQVKNAQLSGDIYDANAIKNALSDLNELDPDEMTDKDVVDYINKFLSIFKGTIVSIIFFLMFYTTFAAVPMPVSPTGVVTNIAVSKNDIPGKTLLYTADAVEIRLNDTKDLIGTGSLQLRVNGEFAGEFAANSKTNVTIDLKVEGTISTKHYPLFILELNSDVPLYDQETGEFSRFGRSNFIALELKGTTNNFFHQNRVWNSTLDGSQRQLVGKPEETRKVFWASTNDLRPYYPADFEPTDMGYMRAFACDANAQKHDEGDTNADDVRSWNRFENAFDNNIYSNPAATKNPRYVAIIIDYAALVERDGKANVEWLSDQNDELIWSYCRFTADRKDVDPKMVWTPCMPVRWYSEMPIWACTNNEERVTVTK